MKEEIKIKEKVLKLNGRVLVFIDWGNVYGWFRSLKWEVDTKRLFNYLSEYGEIFEKRLYHGTENENARSVSFIEDVKNIGFKVVTKDVKWVPILLKESHFKKVIKELFDVLDGMKITNSELSTNLYKLNEKIGYVHPSGFDGQLPDDEKVFEEAYQLIEDLDNRLRELNISIGDLQRNLSHPIQRRKCDFDCEIVMDIMNKLDEFDGIILFSGDGDYKAIVEFILNKGKDAIIVHPSGRRGKEFNELLNKEGKRPYFLPAERLEKFIKKSLPEE